MAQFRLSLTLAVSSVLLSALLIASSPSILPHTSLAQSFAAPVATACSTPTGKEEFASGKIQSINGQNLTLLDDQKHLNFNATYASTTYIRQSSIVALSNLKSGKEIIATFTTNANGTATAEKIILSAIKP